MPSLGSLWGSRHLPQGSTQSLNALEEPHQIEDALRGAALIMNDDVDGAEAALSQGNSPFHKMGVGVVVFLRATLGFEPEIMREASEKLSEAENSAYDHHKHSLKRDGAYQSAIYPQGTEFALCLAQAQLMGAVVGVLNESLTESIKGFYKMRKAYVTLDGVLAAETAYVRQKGLTTNIAKEQSSASSSAQTTDALGVNNNEIAVSSLPNTRVASQSTSEAPSMEASGDEQSDDEDDFQDADETHEELATPQQYLGRLSTDNGNSRPSSATTMRDGRPPFYQLQRSLTSMTLQDGPDKSLFGDHPSDEFVHASSNLCFGILSLLISLIPPTFAMLLKIVGFRGDKDRGLQMLWQATKFHNIYGVIGGLVLFAYYHGLVGFCDILPREGSGSYPTERLKALLADMRQRYPNSQLWKLEEARMMAHDRQVEKAVKFITDSPISDLKQLEALRWFERSLDCMYMHDYEETSRSFQKCVELNNWSHGLYYYVTAAAYLELYRRNKLSDPDEARRQAKKATEFFRMVPKFAGRKRFMARQLPFDTFTVRKIQKWEHRAQQWGCEFVDAIGVSPIEEIIFFWNGYKRMRPEQLEDSLRSLAWSTSEGNTNWEKEDLDEHAILALLKATTVRHMKQYEMAREILQVEILSHDKALFRGNLKDSWTAPCARYELAANLWTEMVENNDHDRERLQEISGWLEEAARWESYDLDARMGIKITTAKDTIRRMGVQSSA